MNEERGKLTVGKMEQMLNWAYEQVLSSHGPIDGAADLAENFRGGHGSVAEDAKALVRWQVAKTGVTGFVAGVGGVVTVPVTLPAELATVLYIHIRMIAAIAHLGGNDLSDDRVRTLCYLCLCGDGMRKILAEVGAEIARKTATTALKRLPGKVLIDINKKVGFRLFTKFGEKGVINIAKMIPVLGGVVSGVLNAVWTKKVGNQARKHLTTRVH